MKVVNIAFGGRGIQAGRVDSTTVVFGSDDDCGHIIHANGKDLPCDRSKGHGGMHSAPMPD